MKIFTEIIFAIGLSLFSGASIWMMGNAKDEYKSVKAVILQFISTILVMLLAVNYIINHPNI